MKTIFDESLRNELIERIQSIQEENIAQWGKMNVSQMAKHCTKWNDWVLGNGNHTYKQDLLGKIFGKWGLKSNTKDDRPMGKNMPSGKAFTIKDWYKLINQNHRIKSVICKKAMPNMWDDLAMFGYFPIQNLENIKSNWSSLVISPVIKPR